ncbi:MAG: 6-hydroxypseudooxynicotine dehydrogenase complex subunit gamma [Alphaproteobacteria bacterium MarineAlpha11_Bin1]|nr:MAG: 6-hydroxypseudooxynicotine dehydrogenase complex subunit gamma [Alphaproteobacteria bacterium MarineAlpha11_Bin1]
MEYQKIGQPVRRREDARLLTGQGRFSDDWSVEGQTYMAVVRSTYAHASLGGIDISTALSMPGVLTVLTGEDCCADKLAPIPHSPLPSTKHDMKLVGPGGSNVFIGNHLPLPTDKARYVGEALAIVVAETLAEAEDAAEAVLVDYNPLPAVTDTVEAAENGAPIIWEEVPDNVCIETFFGDKKGTDLAFSIADHVVDMDIFIDRVTGVPMEPRAALGDYDLETGRFTIYAGSGGSVRQKREIAEVLGVETEKVRVISKDVGGNFGTRNRLYVEFPLVGWASRKIGRPVKWTCQRSESFVSDYQGRDLVTRVSLALDKNRKFIGMRADNLSNVGSRMVSLSPLSKGSGLITGSYDIPVAYLRSRAVFSNTAPTNAYRSSGRPEVTFAIERLVETAAAELGIDPIELRRLNLVSSDQMPYLNAVGMTYDSGEYAKSMEMCMDLADWSGFEERKKEAESRGMLLGRGFANYVESSIGTPREQAEINVHHDGYLDLVIGTQPSGQGHETSFAQVAAEWLGVPVETVNVIVGDTDVVKVGGGSHSGRSMRMAGTVIVKAAEELIAKGSKLAALILEAAESDIEFYNGKYSIAGTDREVSLYGLARKVYGREDLPDDLAGGLSVIEDNVMETPVFPNGCHICEIEIDPGSGAYQVVRYTTVDDVGRAINPLIVDGQTHGGIVQGAGEALGELCAMDPMSGQPLAGSFMDYHMPRADEYPSFRTALNEVPSPTNPLGVKAGGEGGTTPALAVLVNGFVDALRPYGVRDIRMPVTPRKIWSLINAAASN